MKLWFGFIFALLVAFETVVYENIFHELLFLFTTKPLYIVLFYSFATIVGFLSITSIFFLRNRWLFSLFFIFLLTTYGLELVYKNINNVGLSLNDVSIALAQADAFALDALTTYQEAIKKTLVILGVVILFMFMVRRVIHKNRWYISAKWTILLSLFALVLGYSILYRTIGGTETRPTNFKVTNTFIYYLSNRLYYGERDKLLQKTVHKSSYKNIILIVDESVGGKYLSINGYQKETTPYLESIKSHYINLGLASSVANCSQSSNILLMSGASLSELPDKAQKVLKQPNIFQYAKRAGYTTHYISEQSKGKRLQNLMSEYDLDYIDDFFQPKEFYTHKSMPEEDLIKATKRALKDSGKNFFFIVKHGSHFQWEKSYPQSEKHFLPTLNSSDPLSLDKKEEAINSYLNAIRYNVDLFFKYFFKEIDFFNQKDTLIIYTSDHGQSILEEGRTSTHCDSTNPPLTQGIVPLLLFSTNGILKDFHFKKDIYSHYEIMPTIKKFMGYETKQKTFFDINETNAQQTFVSGDIFGRTSLEFNSIKSIR